MAARWEQPSVNGQGNWTYSYVPSSSTVANGIYAFSAVTTDGSGNVSTPTPVTPASGRRFQGPDGGDAPVCLRDPLGPGDPRQPGHHRRWRCHPGRRGGQRIRRLAVHAHAVEGQNSIMVEATNSAGYTSLLSGRVDRERMKSPSEDFVAPLQFSVSQPIINRTPNTEDSEPVPVLSGDLMSQSHVNINNRNKTNPEDRPASPAAEESAAASWPGCPSSFSKPVRC